MRRHCNRVKHSSVGASCGFARTVWEARTWRYLQKVGVFPEGDDDSEDDMVFGDDDFPCGARDHTFTF